MKQNTRLMSLMLVVVMISSLICITPVSAASGDITPTPSTGIEQSVSVDFDTLPSFLNDVATTATVDGRTVASITPDSTEKKFTIDATSLTGASRKKGVLTYSFEYKVSERDSSKMLPGLTLKFGNSNQMNEKGESAGAYHNHIAEFCQKVWNRGGAHNLSTTDWHKVKIDVNYSTGKIWVSVDGSTPVEQANNNLGLAYGAIEHFKLAGIVKGRTEVANQYFYMDNLNITYTERGIEEKRDYAYDMTIFENATDDSRGTVKKLAVDDKFTFDVTDFAGKASKKGRLRYSFDYKTSAGTLTLKYDDYSHVGSQWDNHIAEFRNDGWNRVVDVTVTSGIWHSVVVDIDFATKLATVWVDGVTNKAAADKANKTTGDPRDHSGRINNFDYFQLCGSVSKGDMLIDNMKAEYTERPLYEETAVESYDDATLESFIGGDSEPVSGETYGVIPKSSKTSGDVWLSVDPSSLSGYTAKNGVMEFSLKYKNENHNNDYKVALFLGKHGNSPEKLGYLQGASFRGQDDVNYLDGNGDTSAWHDVNVKVDFVNKKAYVKFGDSDVYTHDISAAMTNGTTNLCRLYTQRGYYEGKPYYVDDIKVSYTESSPTAELLTSTSFAGISSETESAVVNVNTDTEKIAIQFNTAIDTTTLNTANVKLTNVTGYNNSTVEPKWGLIEDVVTYTGTYDKTTNVYTITPDAAALLGKDKWFRLSLTGIKSAVGIPMELGSIYTIRTGKDDMLYMVGDSTLQQKTGEADFADVTAVADVLNASAVKGSATIVNTAAAQTVKYIVAMYEDDRLADVFIQDVNVATGKNVYISDAIDISAANKTGVDKVTLYVWEENNVKPIGQAFNIEYFNKSNGHYNLTTTFIGDAKTTRGFSWEAPSEFENMFIRYGTDEDELSQEVDGYYIKAPIYSKDTALNGIERLFYKAELLELISGETYYYQVGDRKLGAFTEVYSFTTEDDENSEFAIIAVTDPQATNENSYSYYEDTLKTALMTTPDAKFICNLGDMTEDGYNDDYWDLFFDASSGIKEELPLVSVIGNHETRNSDVYSVSGVANYNLRFNNPNNGYGLAKNYDYSGKSVYAKPLFENLDNTVYSFDYGNTHFAVLNTGTDWDNNAMEELMSLQKEWLSTDLKASTKQWKVVLLHRGIYGADPTKDQGPRQIFLDVIDECEVDLVLQGHDHVYMRTHQLKGINTESYIVDMDNDMVQGAGTVYSVVGSAALKRYDAKEVDYAAINVSLPTYDPSYTVIKFNDDSIEFIAKTNSGTLLDRFTINKN